MKIVLRRGPGCVIGDVDGRPLLNRDERLFIGEQPVRPSNLGEALVDAVDEAATRVFGPVWVKKLGVVAGLGLRRCQRDRIKRFGLPPLVLEILGAAAAHDNPRALGDFMIGVARDYNADSNNAPACGPQQEAEELGASARNYVATVRTGLRGRSR